MIAIVDYGVGNVRSVERALAQVGAESKLTANPDELDRAAGLVLPGVGAFGPALAKLASTGLGRRVVEIARRGRPVLGVCLGYQLLFEESMEHGRHEGLALLSGSVQKIGAGRRLPVIGWCRVTQTGLSPLWAGVGDGSYMYFAHSFTPVGCGEAIATAEHAPAAAAAKGKVMGTQFHPEKSGPGGLLIYENFVKLCA